FGIGVIGDGDFRHNDVFFGFGGGFKDQSDDKKHEQDDKSCENKEEFSGALVFEDGRATGRGVVGLLGSGAVALTSVGRVVCGAAFGDGGRVFFTRRFSFLRG